MTGNDAFATRDDWNALPISEKHAVIQINNEFSRTDMERIKKGSIPREMEDKWFIFYEGNTLYMHRSWTGFCIYEADFEETDGVFTVSRCIVTRDDDVYRNKDDDADVKQFVELVSIFLLGKSPFEFDEEDPTPEDTLRRWSNIGRAMLGQLPDADDDEGGAQDEN